MAEEVMHAEQMLEDFVTGSPSLSQVSYGVPTIDRPYGVSLWPLFRYAVYQAFGYDVESFEYEYDQPGLPLSSVSQVTFAIVAYYVIIFGGRWALSSVRPIRFNVIFKLHNAMLTLLSAVLFLLLSEQVFPKLVRGGVFYSVCSYDLWYQKIVLIYYLNYLTKYYELLDTVFLVLRKRPLTFLHTYHHGATAVLCFTQLNGRTAVSWVPILLNLAVHVLMYFYYLLSAFGIRPWWKHWVTRFQIIQFIIDLGFVYFATYAHFVYKYFRNVSWLYQPGDCSGDESAAVHGCLVLSSYLMLFISFYIKSYLAPKVTSKAKGTAAPAATAKKAAPPSSSGSTSSSGAPRRRNLRSRKA